MYELINSELEAATNTTSGKKEQSHESVTKENRAFFTVIGNN